ncbi:MAG: hypothetical protein NWS00_06155 [Opitutales bacterium]|nr:hypothetical protein [Opitutales bacterium]
MKLLTFPFLFCATLFCASYVHADSEIDVIRDENHIPFHALMTRDVDVAGSRLQVGERVVVLRPLSEKLIRVEVSRKGIFTLPVEATDVGVEIQRSKQSNDSNYKLIPRMAFFLTNRIISGESMWQDTLPVESVHAMDRWILLYGDATTSDTQVAVIKASEYYRSLSAGERKHTAFVSMDVVGNKTAIQLMAENVEPSIQCMPGYLSRGYAQSLDHVDPDKAYPQLIELASSGRIIRSVQGVVAVSEWLDQQ